MRSYIEHKKRGVLRIQGGEEGSEAKDGSDREEGSEAKSGSDREESGAAEIVEDSKDAREIDWLKLLCALIVLYVAETTITEKQIHDAIIKEVTEITKASTTFRELKSEFATISKIETILQRDSEKLSILRQLLECIVECLNNTEFVSIPIELFLKANESLFSSIDKSTSDVLIGFFNKAQKLAREQSGDLSEEIETKKQIDGAQIDAANKFIKEKVTKITETSTTFYELKSAFEAILRRDAKKLSILQPLLKDIGIRLNDTTFVPVSIAFLIAINKLTDDSIYEDTKTALSGFLEKAEKLASERSGDPSEEMSQMISDINKEQKERSVKQIAKRKISKTINKILER